MSAPTLVDRLEATSLRDLLNTTSRWLYLLALPLALTTGRIGVAGIHVTPSDVLAGFAGVCWALTLMLRPAPVFLAGARWPMVAVLAGAFAFLGAADRSRALLGVAELTLVWVVPAIAIPSLFETRARIEQLLVSVSVGGIVAAVANLSIALSTGFEYGIPQVWGPADYFQGYFQVVGLSIAIPRLLSAFSRRSFGAAPFWALAVVLHSAALLVAQTRGALLSGAATLALVAVLGGRWVALAATAVLALVVMSVASADWAFIIRERVLSMFTFEAGRVGFDSSIIRLTLLLTALRMFADHPFFGVGLGNFVPQLASYAPAGLPEAVEMGPSGLLTTIEGPHSTYLALLAEAGVLGFIALVAWEFGAVRRLATAYRRGPTGTRLQVVSLIGAVTTVAVFNCFSEMNATGALPFVAFLSLAYRMPHLVEAGSRG